MRLNSRSQLRVEGLESRVLLAADVSTLASSCGSLPAADDGDPAYIAGDANRDGQFDQTDIVRVLSTGKYLRDEPAAWSEGDWNADNRFDQMDIIASLQAGDYLTESDSFYASAAAARSVRLPADSVDGLAAAIAAAGPRGTVIVEAGVHTESSSVLITDPITIVGEDGAVVEFDSDAWTDPPPRVVDAGFHIKNTQQVRIQGLEIRDNDTGSTAILIEGSRHVSIEDNRIVDFQFGVLVESADHSAVEGNDIGSSSGERLPFTSFDILVVNGFGNQVRDNTASDATFGIFASGENGKLLHNTTSENFVGIIMCNATPIELPDERVSKAEVPATGWLAQGNTSTNNAHVGYLVIDNANHNVLTNNEGGDNGLYDIELTADTYRFGFLTPAAFDNVVNAGSQKDITIKDCGNGNQVHGGIQVDTLMDPCF